MTPPWHAYRLAENLPAGLGLIEVPEVGHMTPIQAPDAVTQAVHSLVEDYLLIANRPVARAAPVQRAAARHPENTAQQEAG
jgi:hypothetical protein